MSRVTKCSACGGMVAASAKACPHCGHRVKAGQISIVRILGLMAFIFCGLIGFLFPVMWIPALIGLALAVFA